MPCVVTSASAVEGHGPDAVPAGPPLSLTESIDAECFDSVLGEPFSAESKA